MTDKKTTVYPSSSFAGAAFETLHEIVAKARQNLSQNAWDYIVGGTETETTVRRNRLALDQIAFRPRVLRDVSGVDPTTSQFGRTLRLPVLLAPIGSLEAFHEEAAVPVARAAGAFGIPHMLSSVTQPGLDAVADAAPDTLRLYQLYVREDADGVDRIVAHAIERGIAAFAFTVDSAIYSRRERDLAKRHVTSGRRYVGGQSFQASFDWRSIERIKKKFAIPLILKGIGTAEDAKLAVEHGVDWVYVSNHGGRQLDHGTGAMDVLPEVVAAVAGRAKIAVDGGFCRGTDIVKALAAGADLVGLGRMQCYGLAAGGEAGVVRVLELLEDEVRRCLMMLGADRLAALERANLQPAAAVNPPGVLSAFPLLEIPPYRY
ncbi:MAG: alpha-hydroxy-acid oxidizing protein [Alphaproteobacteria bacterium]|nr:alpha-hydroxy-acid oxidizing protein [Alphaproteobacteria bacterium]